MAKSQVFVIQLHVTNILTFFFLKSLIIFLQFATISFFCEVHIQLIKALNAYAISKVESKDQEMKRDYNLTDRESYEIRHREQYVFYG